MTREHLYKAKRVNWRELPKEEWWVEGYLAQRKGSDGKVFESWIILDAYEQFGVLNMKSALVSEIGFNCYKVDPDTICEYMGSPDKNGGKIFEGDIIKWSGAIGEVKWYHGNYTGWYVDEIYMGEQQFTNEMWNECEIIGNIFDNHELLKGGSAE